MQKNSHKENDFQIKGTLNRSLPYRSACIRQIAKPVFLLRMGILESACGQTLGSLNQALSFSVLHRGNAWWYALACLMYPDSKFQKSIQSKILQAHPMLTEEYIGKEQHASDTESWNSKRHGHFWRHTVHIQSPRFLTIFSLILIYII